CRWRGPSRGRAAGMRSSPGHRRSASSPPSTTRPAGTRTWKAKWPGCCWSGPGSCWRARPRSPPWTCWRSSDPRRRLRAAERPGGPAGGGARVHVDSAGPATRLPLSLVPPGAVTILVRLPRRPSIRPPAALSRTSFVAQARSGASGNRQTLARGAVTDSSGQTIDPPDREPVRDARTRLPAGVDSRSKKPMTFETLGLSPALLRALSENGYDAPTPIQLEAIPPALAGHDLLGGAQTGTGKTAAFGLPLLQRLSKSTPPSGPRKPRALVLVPTREL